MNGMVKRRISLEVIPPRNLDNIGKYVTRLKPLVSYIQQFSVTCHEHSNVSLHRLPSSNLSANVAKVSGYDRSLAMTRKLKEDFPQIEIIFHFTCYNLNRKNIDSKLQALKSLGIEGLLIISGEGYRDWPGRVEDGSFCDSLEVVKYINRNHYGLFKTLAVSGYPNGHPDSPSYHEDLLNLKQKIDAGANLILTQCIYLLDEYQTFLHAITTKLNIDHVPVHPTICLYESLEDLQSFASVARISPPASLIELLVTTSDHLVKDVAYRTSLDLSKRLFEIVNLNLHISPINRFELTLDLIKELITSS